MTAPARPLSGVRVLEFAGLGPVPFAAMLLADMGADIVRIARPGDNQDTGGINRGRRVVTLDMATDGDRRIALDLAKRADVLIEGFRPGVLERMGLTPDELHRGNPALVIGRMTAWGQDGQMAAVPGHDINVLALTGMLAAIGPADRPVAPLNVIADYGGGALYLALGIVSALLAARATGQGSVIDCAMCDGTASLLSLHHAMWQSGTTSTLREANLLDGGAPFYAVYRCADKGFVAVGAIEPRFYANLLAALGLSEDPLFARQLDRTNWTQGKARMAQVFAQRTREQWVELFAGIECCATPVLTISEATEVPHFRQRGLFVTQGAATIAAPAPRIGGAGTPASPSFPAEVDAVLADWPDEPAALFEPTAQERP